MSDESDDGNQFGTKCWDIRLIDPRGSKVNEAWQLVGTGWAVSVGVMGLRVWVSLVLEQK